MRIIASAVIICIGWICGGMFADKEKQGFEELNGMIMLLNVMKERIGGGKAMIYKVFSEYHNAYLEKNGFIAALREGEGLPVGRVWCESVGKLCVKDDVKMRLVLFGEGLGCVDYETQLMHIDGCLSFLKEKQESESKKLKEKLKSYRSLGLLCGCLTAIILY